MKKILIISLIGLLLAASCRPDSEIPQNPGSRDEEEIVSIAFLKTLYKGAPVRITGEYRIEGAVVSDDRQGNFYKTLVVDDGTSGIELRLDTDEIFRTFLIHSRVMVRCNGLWLGSYGGTLQLGTAPYGEYEIQHIPPDAVAEHLRIDTGFRGEVRPRVLSFPELTPRDISTFAAFENVQFAGEETGLGWAEEDTDTDTDRHLVDAEGDTLIVRTSRYAAFAGRLLPAGSGRIEGVVGYFNGQYRLVVCDDQKAEMENPRFLLLEICKSRESYNSNDP